MDVFQLTAGEGPLIAAAIHNGHWVRPEIADSLAVNDVERLREEDPFTDFLIEWAPMRLIGCRSRYEVDLNRSRDMAVYLTAEQAWGVEVWRKPLTQEAIARSLASYDLFYAAAEAVIRQLVEVHGKVIILDVHTYNHRRDGAGGRLADAESNPEVNVGTGSLDRDRWVRIVDGFMDQLRSYAYLGRHLDVRENVKFQGGHFSRWVHQTFPGNACALAVEFKKFFMNEWTGEVDRLQLSELQAALRSTAPRLLQLLGELHHGPFSKSDR